MPANAPAPALGGSSIDVLVAGIQKILASPPALTPAQTTQVFTALQTQVVAVQADVAKMKADLDACNAAKGGGGGGGSSTTVAPAGTISTAAGAGIGAASFLGGALVGFYGGKMMK